MFVGAICLGMGASLPVFAAAPSLQDDLERIDVERIDHDDAWLALLHYRTRGSGMESEADRPRFFLSPQGKTSPRAELLAAVTALHTLAGRQDLACRFPARYEWLRQRLGPRLAPDLGADDPLGQCPQLAEWVGGFPGRRVSINFASSYLENPSSTFGHTFLKVFRHAGTELLSPTINYAARTDTRDSELAFVFKGLFGGFPGMADELPFYRRLRTYTEIEGRDIHEYLLALTPDEVRRLLLHTWEIKDGIFDYYFVHKNCAYHTLALLDVARPEAGLLKGFGSVTVPVDTIRALRAAGMLGEQSVWPSLPKQVRELETQVSAEDAGMARQLALGVADDAARGAQPMARHAGTLQLAYAYGSVLIDRDEGDRARRKEILGAITVARLGLDNPEVLASQARPFNPEDGHDGALLAAGVRRRSGRNALSLEYAAFQHTLTDPLPGYEPHAEIRVLHPELEIVDGRLRLRRIDWLLVQSTIPSSALFSPRAWRLELTTTSAPYADREHLTTGLTYHSGKAWAVGANSVFSALPGLSAEAGGALPHRVALAGVLRVALTRQGTGWSGQLEHVAEQFFAGSALRRQGTRATGELRLSRNLSFTIAASETWKPRRAHELLISLKWRQRSPGQPWRRD